MTDEEAVQCLFDLVSTPSETGSESRAVRWFAQTMEKRGLATEVDSVGNGIARSPQSQKRLMFLGHIDTVPGRIEPRTFDGLLYGRGAVDAKGPLATAMAALSRARDVPGIEVVAAIGEEGPSIGAHHIVQESSPECVVIGEPGGSDSIVLGYKGSMRARITFTQSAAHSAGSAVGVCDVAFEAWARIKDVCRTLSPGEAIFDQLTPALLRFTSNSDGLEDNAELQVGFRLPLAISMDAVQSDLANAASPGRIEFAPADLAHRSRRDTPLVSWFVRSIRSEGMTPRYKVKTGTSDMNVVAPVWGCPVVAYGPGDSSLDHTPNEHISVDEFLRGVRVLTHVFQEWGRA